MRALVAHAVGEPAAVVCLETRAVREPGNRQVRIRVQAAPINPNDLHIHAPGMAPAYGRSSAVRPSGGIPLLGRRFPMEPAGIDPATS